MTCYDKQQQLVGPDPNKYTDAQMRTFNAGLDKCVGVCGDEHIRLLPAIRDRLVKTLKQCN